MSTNDTLRALLKFVEGLAHDERVPNEVSQECASVLIYVRAALAEPVSGGEFGDAYQGAREDLAIWKKRALEAEKALREEQILTERLCNALNDENGPTFMGEPNLAALNGGAVAGQSPVHWRAVLSAVDVPKQPNHHLHVVGFTNKVAGENWIAAQKDFNGWSYTLEDLYAAPICDCRQGRDACTCKPLESERGGE